MKAGFGPGEWRRVAGVSLRGSVSRRVAYVSKDDRKAVESL